VIKKLAEVLAPQEIVGKEPKRRTVEEVTDAHSEQRRNKRRRRDALNHPTADDSAEGSQPRGKAGGAVSSYPQSADGVDSYTGTRDRATDCVVASRAMSCVCVD
jgi:hypothetical protein